MCLDLQLRLLTDHKLTLAQVMQDLWNKYGKTGVGTDNETFLEHLNSYPGVDLTEFMHTALHTTKPLPLQTLLQSFGVKLQSSFAADDNSHNGKRATESLPVQLGAKYKGSSQGLELLTVYANEPAKKAGLAAGDRIIALDDLQVTDTNVKELLSRFAPGQATRVHAFRRDELMTLTIDWTAPRPHSRILTITHPERLHGWLAISETPTKES